MVLPHVKAETGYSVAESLNDPHVGTTIKQELQQIKEENPVIARLIRRWSKLESCRDKAHSAMCGILVYKMLRSQAEADQLAAEFAS